MTAKKVDSTLSAKGRALLRVIVAEIDSGRVMKGDRRTFIPYSEALAALGQPNPQELSGRRLQREGLTDLNEWTKAASGIPHVCGLIVNKSTWLPSEGYPESHGFPAGTNWERWWMDETAKSVDFDWTPHL
jgi:hypothetical protein